MERKPVVPVAPTTRIEREFSTEVIASTVQQKRAMHNMHIMHVHCHDANAATIVTYNLFYAFYAEIMEEQHFFFNDKMMQHIII